MYMYIPDHQGCMLHGTIHDRHVHVNNFENLFKVLSLSKMIENT